MKHILAILFVFLTIGLFAQVPNGPYLRLSTFSGADTTKVLAANGVVGVHGIYLTLYLNDQLQVLNKGANNGMSSTYGFYQLGGMLIKNTTIEGNSKDLSFGTSESSLSSLPIYITTGDLDINLSGAGSSMNINGTNAMLGIGVLPSYKLHIAGTTNNQNLFLVEEDGGADILAIGESGGVSYFNASRPITYQSDFSSTFTTNQAVSKKYVDDLVTGSVSGYWPLSGTGTLVGNTLITGNYTLGFTTGAITVKPYSASGTIFQMQNAASTPIWTTGYVSTSVYHILSAPGTSGSFEVNVNGTNSLEFINSQTTFSNRLVQFNRPSSGPNIIIGAGAGDPASTTTSGSIWYDNVTNTFRGYTSSAQTFLTDGALTSSNSPSQITSDQNNYNPTDARWYRLDSDAARSITGWVAPYADGDELEVHNIGSYPIDFPHEDTDSDAANRWLVPGGGTLTLSPGQSATWRYDATTQRWRLKEYTG